MQITEGLLEGQVLQRDRTGRAKASLKGSCAGDGVLEARVLGKGRPVKSLNWHRVGAARGGSFEGLLKGVPAGGPYRLELRVSADGKAADRLTLREFFVGDVWFLGGQSNMQGIGNLEDAPAPHPLVRAFYMRDEWGQAQEPLHVLAEAVDYFHNAGVRMTGPALKKLLKNTFKGVGPGLFFGREMVRRTRVPQGLVICGHGGTSMDQWSPDLKDQGGKSLYGAWLRRFRKLGQPIRGILWYQGESDAGEATAPSYTDKMKRLIAETRKDFGQRDLPWMIVQIGRVVMAGWTGPWWNRIQEEQRLLPERVRNVDVVPTVDLGLDDNIHISGESNGVLGLRLARIADRLALGNRKEAGGLQVIDAKPIVRIRRPRPARYGVEIRFRNVAGGLRSPGRPFGFVAVDVNGNAYPAFFKTHLEKDRVWLETSTAADTFFAVSYGNGCDPACNVTDARGMGVPAFGPLPLSGLRGSAFLVHWRMVGPFPLALGLKEQPMPEAPAELLPWRVPFSALPSLIMPQDVHKPQPGWFCFRTAFEADAARDVLLSMGSDAPYKVWLNGREVACDLKATNPCNPDEYRHRVQVQAGRNDLVVLFDGRNGMGWGICARFLPSKRRGELAPEAIRELKES